MVKIHGVTKRASVFAGDTILSVVWGCTKCGIVCTSYFYANMPNLQKNIAERITERYMVHKEHRCIGMAVFLEGTATAAQLRYCVTGTLS